ncbi:MAG: hypothetical protein RQ885_01510 [Desulfurococcales archaeon]|nr:hypothetical protein [Desulfurococcales archaeon]
MSSSKCEEYYKLYRDLEQQIILIISKRSGTSYDELRDELERRGMYMDGRCLRKEVAKLVRNGRIIKIPDQTKRKLLLALPSP